ncbi:Thioredoxin-dependent 5'-adenylylsulfate reductase [Pontiella desulfatans]|uniref:Adenosine 5'-phosphosulfate reductase n=1 Tax=Pontiella desulfatans TaxID=2750659 RepID=A0A6C2TX93_PONDE|nr:phosphoadenylyl-sulfate reductase [Pontiella desulfatans]VGO12124.1 Thioredoxin-dependent 5'-adenylylsulfate reductase [Pontiella desulfatans]
MEKITENLIESLQNELSEASAQEIVAFAATHLEFPVFATSLGEEDQVITDIIAKGGLNIPVFTLDTGRLFPETYELIATTESTYGLKIKTTFPDANEVERMVAEEGINLFRKSIESRKRCCGVRKMQPLRRMLGQSSGWICGLRRDQSPTRTGMHAIEWDAANNLPKFNPLIDWSLDDVRAYIQQNGVPCNPLHAQGFVSIGCACCTRAIQPGEDIRAGRWWWEAPEQKECGLHVADGKIVRTKDLNQ